APLGAQRLGNAREAIAGQVDEVRELAQPVEVDGLRTARGLARAGETASPEERIDGARLADVRAAREGDLGQLGRRQVARMTDGAQELRLGEEAHGCRNREILIKSALS